MQNIWEQRYKQLTDMWGVEPEYSLVKYQELINKGRVLDLGIGEGRNVARFALEGYAVDGVDISETALDRCGKMLSEVGCEHHLYNEPVQDFIIKTDKYSLIISTWTLQFMKKSEAYAVMERMKAGLCDGGVIYIGVFSKDDPRYNELKSSQKEVEKDTFYIERFDSHVCFFDRGELETLFSDDYELICSKCDFSLDVSHGDKHYHGAVEVMVKKKEQV